MAYYDETNIKHLVEFQGGSKSSNKIQNPERAKLYNSLTKEENNGYRGCENSNSPSKPIKNCQKFKQGNKLQGK